MSPSTRGGNQPLATFETDLRLPDGFAARPHVFGTEYDRAVNFLTAVRPSGQNSWPALSLGFIIQAEILLAAHNLTRLDDVFASFPPSVTAGTKVVNTLTFTSGTKKFGVRGPYTAARDVIVIEMRRTHPNMPAHATQGWDAYTEFIHSVFRAEPGERLAIAEWIWEAGVIQADERRLTTAVVRVVRPFEAVLADMPTQKARPGGALFQALVFGYFRADSPNLTIESHSVNTSSAHASIIGDVAGFRGREVELAVEVKDKDVNDDNVDIVLGDFLEDLVDVPNVTAVVVAHHITEKARAQLALSNVIGISREELRERVVTWDLPKQQEALRGAFYYLYRVQKSPKLHARLLDYLESNNLDAGI